jgi:hypothetical protein
MASSISVSLVCTVRASSLLIRREPVAREPAEGSFYAPSYRSNSAAMRAGCTLDNFEIPVAHHCAPIGPRFPSLRTVSPDNLEPRTNVFESRQESTGPLRLLPISRRHVGVT